MSCELTPATVYSTFCLNVTPTTYHKPCFSSKLELPPPTPHAIIRIGQGIMKWLAYTNSPGKSEIYVINHRRGTWARCLGAGHAGSQNAARLGRHHIPAHNYPPDGRPSARPPQDTLVRLPLRARDAI